MRVNHPGPMRLRAAAAFLVWAALAAGAFADEHVWTSRGPADVAWVTDAAIGDRTAYAGTLNGVFRSVDRGSTWQSSGLKGQWISQVVGRSGASAAYAGASDNLNATTNLYATRDGGETWTNILSDVSFAAVDPEEASTVWAGLIDGVIVKSEDAGSSWNVFSREFAHQYIAAIAFDAHAIYVNTYDGLFQSLDGGASWAHSGPPAGPANFVFAGTGALYVTVGGGIFCRTSDSAQTWTCSNTNVNFIRVVEIPRGPGAAPWLLASSDLGLRLSGDSGVTWAPLGGELGTTANIQGLVVDEASGLILAGDDRRMFRSLDFGASWAPASSGLESTWIRALALHPREPSNLWAGALSHAVDQGPGLFHSIDSGLSWSWAGAGSPPMVDSIALDPSDPSTILAGNAGTVFRSEDGGVTWSSSRPGQYATYALAIDPESPNRVFAAVGEGLMRSEDSGHTWSPTRGVAQAVYNILLDQRHPEKVYAGSYYDYSSDYGYMYPKGGSIFVSVDHGANFTKSVDVGSFVYSIAPDPFHDSVLYVGTAVGVSTSVDGGTHWRSASTGLAGASVLAVVADPALPGHLYAGTDRGVFRTVDGAHTWEPFSDGLESRLISTLVISPDGSRLHAGTGGGGVYDVDLREPPPYPCVPSSARLCLVGNRYAVDLVAARRGETRYDPGAAHALGDRAGYFGLPSATGDPDLPEIIVKVLGEGAFGQPGAVVFYTSLTTLPYGLTVTDTVTGEQQVYSSNRESPMCGGADRAFEELASPLGSEATALAKTASALELLGGGFSVTLEAHHPRTGQTVTGQATTLTDRSGFFGIAGVTGDPQFPEVVVKMVDGRGINGDFWFFHAGLTGLDYTLTVTDEVTGAVRTYESPGAFCGSGDITLPAH